MRVSLGENGDPCRNCGREFPASRLDRHFWCHECRAEVVRRSSIPARIIAIIMALASTGWTFYLVGSSPRFLIVYVVLIVAVYLLAYKVTQRVAFEIIRSRGVPPPDVPSDA